MHEEEAKITVSGAVHLSFPRGLITSKDSLYAALKEQLSSKEDYRLTVTYGDNSVPWSLAVLPAGSFNVDIQQKAPRGSPVLPDSSPSVLDQLCAPFPSELFPRHFNPAEITSLLNAPFAASVPVTESEFLQYQPLCPGLFRVDQTMSALKLEQRLAEALYKDWPLGTPSELLYTPFWDSVGFQFPEFAGRIVGVSLVENRNVVDTSITLPDKRRDWMMFLRDLLLAGGEDKPKPSDIADAENELLMKHKGANAALYGDLGYIILIATAASTCRVCALDLRDTARLVRLFPDINMVSPAGRQQTLRVFINLTRWLRTIEVLQLLPPPPAARLLAPFSRPSPYEGVPDVELTIHMRYVEKRFAVPCGCVSRVLDVYRKLKELKLPGAIKCTNMQVNEIVMDLTDATCNPRRTTSKADVRVVLELRPVGARPSISSDTQLQHLVRSLLNTLRHWHARGYIHGDVRIDNVVKYFDEWILLDWEVAGKSGALVWWRGQELPMDVKAHRAPYTCQTDLWQIGKLIQRQPAAGDAARRFADQLLAGELESVDDAEQQLWIPS